MVNDLLNELYLKVTVPHWIWLLVRCLTTDKDQVSIVMDLAAQISDVSHRGSAESPQSRLFAAFSFGIAGKFRLIERK
ncbi:hypothetical protein N2601_29645 (plasmid) [Rhizobium sp. CB3060]|uniref:hypothetical protein n=1 Tax=Rhizobium sp. CB3060 TaxID=3138255 RepID=UPI0021A6DDC8|nr:hypothetical protein [Rhizobium tropici]UWU25620.1 hypothetical protein N2601_29645 [Rhizobium tropici]